MPGVLPPSPAGWPSVKNVAVGKFEKRTRLMIFVKRTPSWRRAAETRAVNRALRKAYGIGICSVDEIGSFAEPAPSCRESKKLPPQPVNGKNGNTTNEP
jgi:hypothetical protein